MVVSVTKALSRTQIGHVVVNGLRFNPLATRAPHGLCKKISATPLSTLNHVALVIWCISFCLFFSNKPNYSLSNKHLVVVEVVYEGGEASGLVLQGQCQDGNMANEYGVKELCDLQVVAGTQRLENNWAGYISEQSCNLQQHIIVQGAHAHCCLVNTHTQTRALWMLRSMSLSQADLI